MKLKMWSSLKSIKQNWNIDRKELVLWAIPFLLFSGGIFSGKVFFWGTLLLQFIPWRHLALEMIKRGEFPLWNPLSGMGAPLLANYQSALLYPPTWVLIVLEAVGGLRWSAVGQGVLLALHLGFCAIGMKRWLKYLGLGELGQMVGGIAFGLSGYLVSRASFQSILFSASYMPWIVFYAQRLISTVGEERRKTLTKLVVLLVLNLLCGHAQTSWYILWTASCWIVLQGYLISRKKGTDRWKTISSGVVTWGVALGWAFLIAAPQLIPTAEYLFNSQRSSGVDREIGLTYSFWPWRFLTLLMPDFFGNPAQGNFWGYANYWEDAVFSGSMALILAAMAFGQVHFLERHPSIGDSHKKISLKPVVDFWWILGVGAMILAVGKHLPFYFWLLDYMPGFDLFQAPTRISLIAQFGLATLTAVGIDLWETPQKRILYWTRLSMAGFFSVFVVSTIFSVQYRDFYPTILLSVQRFGFSGFLFVFLLLLKPRARTKAIWTELKRASFQSSQLWEAMIFLFFLIDLLWMGAGLNPVISKEIFNLSMADSLPRRENSPSKRFFMNAAEEYNVKFERFFRFDTFRNFDDWVSVRRSWLPNLNLLDGIAMVNNFDPLVPARYAKWIKEISDAWEKGKTDSYHRLLALSGVKTLIETDGYTYQFVSLNGNERVQFFTCAEWAATPQEALIKVVSDAEVGVGKVVLESDREVVEEACRERTMNAASIRILSESAQRIQIEVRTNSAGWLVLNDTFYPGWIVTVNGTKETMIAANSLFRAVSVGEGTSLVEFRYQPFSFAMGLILSILAFSALLHYNRSGWTPNV